ncbi:DEAD/DEAH box helicase [Rhodobacterales bacterium 52_120_T64]|nr:DEAD/DEAH box helicase [Rhodobacterales bacterium 52_120_T64]
MTSFNELGLDSKVLQAVVDTGYTTPTPIQAEAIPHALQGKDVLGIAQTGTGKTASFTLPMITMLSKGRARARMPRSLVLCPTRELAAQVAENFETYAKHVKLSMALLIGGVSFKDQDRLIDRGVDVLIATPGRLLDHFERGKLMLNGVQIMVVDEADRMLDMGFIPDIERIFKLTPFTRQTLFFSATMAPEITRITQEFLHNPVRVEVARQATTSETITQAVCMHTPSRKDQGPKDKRDILRAIIDAEGESLTNAIIFCNRKRDVDIVAKSLKKHGLDASALHGDLDQSLRMKILNGFRDGELKLLVASDVAARGLDIPNVSHVFNFDVPIHSEDYVHRIGRTGRAGREGTAITLCLPFEEKYLTSIEALVKKEIPRMDNPLKTKVSASKSEEKPTRQSRPKRNADKPKAVEAPKEKVAQPVKTEAPKPAPRENNTRPDNNRRPQRGRGRGRDNGPSVIGMGDHMPAFMTRDLRALQVAATPKEVEEEPEVIEEVVAVETPVEEAPKKPRRRRAPKKKAEENAPVEEQPAETAVVEEAAEEKPVKKPRKRRVTKKKEETPVAETPVDKSEAE